MGEVLRPDTVWIEGRCYRITDNNSEASAYMETDLYEEEVYPAFEDNQEDNYELDKIDNRYSSSFYVSPHYLGSIIGKKGATCKRIEIDMAVVIKIPKRFENGNVTIIGQNPSNVKAARKRINAIVVASRFKQKPTHFISIPMNSPDIIERFNNLKEIILRDTENQGIEESIFIAATKLHITIGVMCLMDKEERLEASRLLSEVKDKVISPMMENQKPLRIKLKGLSYMNDEPDRIHVLYGEVSEENAPEGFLQTLADKVLEHFHNAGFMPMEHGRNKVKLHVTLMNSKYRSSNSDTNISKRETFNGSRILKEYKDYEFGVAEMKSMHLSQRGTINEDGYYQATHVINLQ